MKRFAIRIAVNVILAFTVANVGYAQTAAPSTSTPSTLAPMTGIKPDRTIADKATRQEFREKETALKLKRAECSKEAKEQKVSVFKRQRFIHNCMSR